MTAGENLGPQFVHQGKSPLDYASSTWIKPERFALVDPSVGEPPTKEFGFVDRNRKLYTNPETGRRWKNPRTVVDPGAAPGTIAFVDYEPPGARKHSLFINYTKTRNDFRNQGHSTRLIDELIKRHPGANVDFGKVMNENMAKVMDKTQALNPDREPFHYKKWW